MRSFVAGAVALALVGAGASRAADKEIEWAKSFDEAMKSAKQSGKLVMVDVFATWCGPCKMLDKQTYGDAKVVAFAKKNFVSVKVDADTDEGKKVGEKYQVSALPTILLLDAEGDVQWKTVGFIKAAPFLAKADLVQKAFKELPGLLTALKQSPGDAQKATEVIAVYAMRGKVSDADKVLQAALKAGASEKDMAAAFNAIGDSHQEAGRLPQAIRLFRRAADAGGPKEKVYALSSIGACLMTQGKLKEALAEVEKSLAVPGAPESEIKDATTLRDQLKEALDQSANEEKKTAEEEKKFAAAHEKSAKLMGWAKDFNEALAQAKESKKLAMIDFTAEWCGWCKKLDADVYADETAAKALREAVVGVQLDVDSKDGKPVAEKYKSSISGLPTILFIDEGGDVVGRIVGYKPAVEFVKATKEVVTAAKEFPNLLAAWKKDDKNVEAGLKIAKTYVERGDNKNAQAVLKKLEANGVDMKRLGAIYFEIAQALVQADDESGEAILKRLSTDGNADERAKALMMMGMAKANKRDFEGAKDLVDKAVKIEGVSETTLQRAEQLRGALQRVLDQMKKGKDAKKDG